MGLHTWPIVQSSRSELAPQMVYARSTIFHNFDKDMHGSGYGSILDYVAQGSHLLSPGTPLGTKICKLGGTSRPTCMYIVVGQLQHQLWMSRRVVARNTHSSRFMADFICNTLLTKCTLVTMAPTWTVGRGCMGVLVCLGGGEEEIVVRL